MLNNIVEQPVHISIPIVARKNARGNHIYLSLNAQQNESDMESYLLPAYVNMYVMMN